MFVGKISILNELVMILRKFSVGNERKCCPKQLPAVVRQLQDFVRDANTAVWLDGFLCLIDQCSGKTVNFYLCHLMANGYLLQSHRCSLIIC